MDSSNLQGSTAFDLTVDDSDNIGEDCTVPASDFALREAGRQVEVHGFPRVQAGVRPTPVVEQNRFAVLSAEAVPVASRRLVLVSGPERASMDVESQRNQEIAQGSAEPAEERVGRRGEEDTESLPSMDEGSVVSGDEETEIPSLELEVHEPVRLAIRDAFVWMDAVDLGSEFRRRACVMRTVPVFLKGPFRCALQTALDEVCCGIDVGDLIRQARGWKC